MLPQDESAQIDLQGEDHDDQKESSDEEGEEDAQQTVTMKPMECIDCGVTRYIITQTIHTEIVHTHMYKDCSIRM